MNWDFFIFQQINNVANKSQILDCLGIFFAKYIPYLMIIAAIGFFIWIFYKKFQFRNALIALLSIIISRFIFVEIIRLIYFRQRPFIQFPETANLLISHDATASFPSRHASLFFALSFAIYFENKKLGIIFLILSSLMGFARIFCGVHYLGDIIVGAILGYISVLISRKIYPKKYAKI